MFDTAYWVGRFAEIAEAAGCRVHRYAASKWRSYLTGEARNTDAKIRQALRVRFGEAKKGHPLAGIKKHLWDALGVAVYHADGAKLGGWRG